MLMLRDVLRRDMRSGRFICLIVMLIFGCFSITTTSLLIRSDKKTEIEDSLTITGDYDEIIYNTGVGLEEQLSEQDYVEKIGLYYELGSVANIDETKIFKAISFKNQLSEEIYHMTCIRGTYPREDNEIAIDVSVANAYGIAPYPGETLNLKMYDSYGDYIETREYVVSGVFRASSNEALGGWNRCPDFAFYTDSYQMPAVCFAPADLELWNCTKETVFFTSPTEKGESLDSKVIQLLNETGQFRSGVENNYRRSVGYIWYVMGAGFDGDYSTQDIQNSVSNGIYKRDFYSSVIMPIVSVLVIVTEVVSIYMLSKNIIADRKEYYATFRCIGMSAKRIIRTLLFEILGFGFCGAAIGIGLGYAMHIPLVNGLNSLLHLGLYDGIHVEKVVKQITYNPVAVSLLACLLSLTLSLILPLYRLYRMYPAELLSTSDSMFVNKKKGKTLKSYKSKSGWLTLLNKRIDLHDGSTMLVMIIVVSSALFGYVFFRAYSEQATVEARGFMELLNIDGNGYIVGRSDEIKDWSYNVINRHDAGILPSFPELIESNPNVSKSWSVIFNDSTRMVFDTEPDENIRRILGNRLLNIRTTEDLFMLDAQTAEKIVLEHTGYEPDAYMYELPTVGLTTNEMIQLNGEVVSGQIDIEKIRSGEEVVLAVPPELEELCLQYFPVGSQLNFDDILLTDEEDGLHFETLDDDKWIIYENYIDTDMGQTYVAYGAFGTRYTIASRVGAIVVLRDDQDISEYLSTGSTWVNQSYWYSVDSNEDEPTYGMSILCFADSFENWGLPDRNFTSVKAVLSEDCDIYQFDEFWYKNLSGSVDVNTSSTFDYLDVIQTGTNRVMAVFFIMISDLILLGMISIIVGLYTKTRSNSGRFQTLRRIGLSVKQVALMTYTQNMFYPILATLIGIVPICVAQSYINNLVNKANSGELDITTLSWYTRIPILADFFSYDFIPALICCLLLGNALIIIGTLPQILYLKKMKMIESRED
ncbi:MAG: FtsX-like permease family protein [Clostridia bacterium]|nr:FtsX-like permease family protein [Clostridia bacterium]